VSSTALRNPQKDLSDYAKNKIDESNIGYQMLKNAGWTEGQGLGSNEDGITAPVDKYITINNYPDFI